MSEPTSKPPSDREDALAVLTRLRGAGHVAYFAGGCVRDLLLGLTPKDFDVATDAPPDVVRKLFPNTQAVGAAFGVILVRQRKSTIEVATFRTDGAYTDGRRPDSVRFTTAEEDAQRRDFTINGLFLDPIENRIIDYVGGQIDLKARVIRAIGDPAKRFEEDYLRMLRAVRFAARLDFEIEETTYKAIELHASAITRISPERIADELRRMLTPATRYRAWIDLGLLRLYENLFRGLRDTPRSMGLIGSRVLPSSISFSLALAICAWDTACVDLHSNEKTINQAVVALRRSFKLSNDERNAIQAVMRDALSLLKREQTLAQRMRFMAKPTAADTRLLLSTLRDKGQEVGRVDDIEAQLQPLETIDCAPRPLVTGDDLVAAGLSPGPAFKRALDQTYDAQLESRVRDRSDALAMAMELAVQK